MMVAALLSQKLWLEVGSMALFTGQSRLELGLEKMGFFHLSQVLLRDSWLKGF